jgi:hypothetical protein
MSNADAQRRKNILKTLSGTWNINHFGSNFHLSPTYITENTINSTRRSQKVPGILWHLRFGAQWVRIPSGQCLLVYVQVPQRSRDATWQMAGRDNGFYTQPPQSPDLAPSDFWLFPALKLCLKETYLVTVEDIKWDVTAELRKIPTEAFSRYSQQWQDRRSYSVRAEGSYFEGE